MYKKKYYPGAGVLRHYGKIKNNAPQLSSATGYGKMLLRRA
jgi:hypothetical protein